MGLTVTSLKNVENLTRSFLVRAHAVSDKTVVWFSCGMLHRQKFREPHGSLPLLMFGKRHVRRSSACLRTVRNRQISSSRPRFAGRVRRPLARPSALRAGLWRRATP